MFTCQGQNRTLATWYSGVQSTSSDTVQKHKENVIIVILKQEEPS